MKRHGRLHLIIVMLLISVLAAASAQAVDIEKKWRVSFMLGGWNPQDEIDSDAANALVLRDRETLEFTGFFEDPRDDSSGLRQSRRPVRQPGHARRPVRGQQDPGLGRLGRLHGSPTSVT